MISNTRFLCAALSLLMLGCARPAPPGDGATSASASAPPRLAPASAAPGQLGAARALALADPAGSALVDTEIRAHQKRIAKQPEHVESWVLLGRAWIRKAREQADPGHYLQARACADVVLDFSPSNRMARNLIGQALLSDHKFGEARDLAAQILAEEAEDFNALGTLSDALLEMGRYDEAIDAAQKMVSFKPSLPSYARASYLAWLRGDVKTALHSVKMAIDAGNDPTSPEPRAWAMVEAAMIFWHQGDHEGADAGFNKALSTFTDFPPALVGKARVAMAKGEAKHAADLLEKAHRQSPLVDTAWRLGDARAAAGDEKGAQEAYEIVVKDGRRGDHRTLALFFAVKNRDLDEALRLARAEMEVRPGIYTRDALAWVLYRKGLFDEARRQIDQATALGTRDAMLLYHAGAIRIAMGEKEAGERLVKEALGLNAKFDPTGAVEAQKLAGAAAPPR